MPRRNIAEPATMEALRLAAPYIGRLVAVALGVPAAQTWLETFVVGMFCTSGVNILSNCCMNDFEFFNDNSWAEYFTPLRGVGYTASTALSHGVGSIALDFCEAVCGCGPTGHCGDWSCPPAPEAISHLTIGLTGGIVVYTGAATVIVTISTTYNAYRLIRHCTEQGINFNVVNRVSPNSINTDEESLIARNSNGDAPFPASYGAINEQPRSLAGFAPS